MTFTVGVVVVDGEAFVDPRLDTLTPVVRNILDRTTHDQDSFQILTVNILRQSEEEISNVVSNLIQTNSVDWIIVVGGIGFDDNDCTPEAVDPLIKRPCAALVNRILANVHSPFLVRVSAGVSRRALITTLPGDIEDIQRAIIYLINLAPGFLQLLKLLKTSGIASSRASNSSDTRRLHSTTPIVMSKQVLPVSSSLGTTSANHPSQPLRGDLNSPESPLNSGVLQGASGASTNNTQRSAIISSKPNATLNQISRTIEPLGPESRTVVPRSLSPPAPATSETPWRCFTIRVGADIIATNSSQEAQPQPTTVPEANLAWHSFVASPKGELYLYGGTPGPRGLFTLKLDGYNLVATIRKVQAAGICPTPRQEHSAVWIGSSLMVVWGGSNFSTPSTSSRTTYSDTDLHVFNTNTLIWTTLRTSGPSPSPRCDHAMVAAGKLIYIHGGHDESGNLSDFWCLDFGAFSNSQRTQNPQWQNLSSTLSKCLHGDSPGSQRCHRLVAHGNDIILLGTSGRDAVYSYSMETSQWQKCCSPGLDAGSTDSGAVRLGSIIYSHNKKRCKMFNISNNIWLENPTTYSRDKLQGPMTVIGSKIYVLGISPSDTSKLAVFELDPEKIWLPTRAELDAAQGVRDIAQALID